MAKTTTISISSDTTKEEIREKIKAAKPKAGDTLKFSLLNEKGVLLLVSIVLIIMYVLLKEKQNKKSRQTEGTDILNDLFGSQKPMEEVEAEIEEEFGVNLEFEIQQPSTQNNLIEKAAGIWADDDISLEEVREKTWPKRNW